MERETNVGYVITDRLTIGDFEYVIGQSEKAPDKFVIWKCKRGVAGYFWGHYMNDRLSAIEDLCKRAMEEVRFLKSIQCEQHPGDEQIKQAGKRNRAHEHQGNEEIL
jgi:hypothetical protein